MAEDDDLLEQTKKDRNEGKQTTRQTTEDVPPQKPITTINDMLVDCSIEDAITQVKSIKSKPHFGQYICASGWFLKKTFFGSYSSFRATDICWVYPKKTETTVGIIPIVVPLPAVFNIACKLSNGTEITLSEGECPGQKVPVKSIDVLQQLQSLIPWAIFGYSQYLKECWEKYWKLFLKIHNERLAKTQEGLKTGSIIVLPNGSLAVLPTFTLPTIAMKFEKNQKGKLERVYYQTESQQTT